MSERLDLFATPIILSDVPDHDALDDDLADAIRTQQQGSQGVDRSNLGGWHSTPDMTDWGGEPARRLAEFAAGEVSPHMVDIAAAGKRQFDWGIDMWANVNAPGDANQLHCHPGAFWSGVYYVDAGGADREGNGGELVLEDPRYPMAYSTVPDLVLRAADKKAMRSQHAIRPATGRLVLFPSWLRHSVRPHRGDRARISVALNLSLVLSGARVDAEET